MAFFEGEKECAKAQEIPRAQIFFDCVALRSLMFV
jgi:hypothetical protein